MKKPGRAERAAAWIVAAHAMLVAAAVLVPWIARPVDLLANSAAHAMLVIVPATAWIWIRRMRSPGIAAGLSIVVAIVAIGIGRPLVVSSAGEGDISIAVFNTLAGNKNAEALESAVRGAGADVVVLTEVGGPLALRTRDGEAIRSEYPHREVVRPTLDSSPRVIVLSRWPMRVAEHEGVALLGPGIVVVEVESPGGVVGIVGLHAASPRSTATWRAGNERVELASDWAAVLSERMPVVVAGDLNAAPTGWRSRLLARSGLRRAKPTLRMAGTWPAGRSWPATVAIDDVAAGRGVRPVGWRTFHGGGSDHSGVVVDLEIRREKSAGKAD